MSLGCLEKAIGTLRSPVPSLGEPRQPPLASGDSALIYMPERRRIVAQVRRKLPQNRDFFASQDSAKRCDDLLTTTVDNADRAGL